MILDVMLVTVVGFLVYRAVLIEKRVEMLEDLVDIIAIAMEEANERDNEPIFTNHNLSAGGSNLPPSSFNDLHE